MSRVFVKNIGLNTKEEQLRSIFSRCGEITDIKIARKSDGKSRNFAFVGFRTEDQAAEARRYFNNTFIGLSRISVDIAKRLGPADTPNANTGSSQATSPHKVNSTNSNPIIQPKLINTKGKKKSDFMDLVLGREKDKDKDKDVVGFEVNKADVDVTEQDVGEKDYSSTQSDSSNEEEEEDGNKEDSEVLDIDSNSSDVGLSKPQPLDDMAYLRSKISNKKSKKSDISASEDSDSDADDSDSDAADEAEDSSDDKLEVKDEAVPDSSNNQSVTANEEPSREADNNRIYIRNLPFSCSESEVRDLCASFGSVAEVHLPLADSSRGGGRGFGFVSFETSHDARNVISKLHGTPFQGRNLFVTLAESRISTNTEREISATGVGARLSEFQRKKEEERRKSLNKKESWNAAIISSDAVVDSLANRYSVSASDLMDTSNLKGGELAVRLAVGEATVIEDNKAFCSSLGIDLDALESSKSQAKASARSDIALLVKNIAAGAVQDELEALFARFGSLSACLLSPSKTLAVVFFVEPSEARKAYRSLAYRRYKGAPLYLEWAPSSVSASSAAAKAKSSVNDSKSFSVAQDPMLPTAYDLEAESFDDDNAAFGTLFVKNLSFKSDESSLRAHVLRLGVQGLRTAVIQKKEKRGEWLSMGYGFLEFVSQQAARQALSVLHGSVLDAHALEVRASDKRLSPALSSAAASTSKLAAKQSGKLVVRNVAFQATKAEIRSLFSAFGAVKRVRVPKSAGGEKHRGFAFVDFGTGQEAERAMAALKNAHLYGRHLVIEWAQEGDADEGGGGRGGGESAGTVRDTGRRADVGASRKRAMEDSKHLNVIAAVNKRSKKSQSNQGGLVDDDGSGADMIG